MNCQQFAQRLDEIGGDAPGRHFARDELAAVETHARECGDCRAALEAARALRFDPVPEFSSTLDFGPWADASRAGRRPTGSRRLRPTAIGAAAIVLGGAVFAAAGWVGLQTLSGRGDAEVPGVAGAPGIAGSPASVAGSSSAEAVGASGAADVAPADGTLIDYVENRERAEYDALSAGIINAGVLPEGEYFALLKVPPRYPLAAAERGLEGEAVSEFTITPDGDVADITIVESSDPVFDAPTIEATRQMKYKPRVVDGRAVALEGVRNRFVYRLEHPPEAHVAGSGDGTDTGEAQSAADTMFAGDLDMPAFMALLGPAYDCLARNDLRCVELLLDEIDATYRLSADQESRLWQIYGFINHRRGRYEQAIEAYRHAAGPAENRMLYRWANPLLVVANIHFSRQQYQEALDAMIEYLRSTPNPTLQDYLFVDRLRALGAQVR